MTTTAAHLGTLYARRDELDRRVRAASARLERLEEREALACLYGAEPAARGPEVVRLVTERQDLLDSLRVVNRAIRMARDGHTYPGLLDAP